MSPHATWWKPSGIGWNGSCFVGWPVAASDASVRPWKLPSALTTTWRPRPPCLRASLMAHSLASAPEFVKNTWPSWPVTSASRRSISIAARVATGLANRLLTCSSSPACSAMASATTGLAWPSPITARPPRKSR